MEVVPCVGWFREAPWEVTGRYSLSLWSSVLLPGMWMVPLGPKTQGPHPSDVRVVSWGGRTSVPGSHGQCSHSSSVLLTSWLSAAGNKLLSCPFWGLLLFAPGLMHTHWVKSFKGFVFDPKRPVRWVLWSLFLQTRKLRQSKSLTWLRLHNQKQLRWDLSSGRSTSGHFLPCP